MDNQTGATPPITIERDKSVSTTPCTNIPDSPRKKTLKRKLNSLRVKLSRANKRKPALAEQNTSRHIKAVCSAIESLLPEKLAAFVNAQILLHSKKSKKGIRWSKENKLFALSVFYHSRKAYQLLSKLFIMPSKTTLLNLLAKTRVYPGFNDGFLSHLNRKLPR